MIRKLVLTLARLATLIPALISLPFVPGRLLAADWPQWGGGNARRMVSEEKGIPASFVPGEKGDEDSGSDHRATGKVKWVARLGTHAYGTPAISGGKVFVGTNNGAPRNRRHAGDRGVLMCFEEATGNFLWQLVVSKLEERGSFNGDFGGLGICSSPTVEGDRVYLTTNRCEVICLDAKGLGDGNDGPFLCEGEYVALEKVGKPGKPPEGVPPPGAKRASGRPEGDGPAWPPPSADDADILWRYDMISELDVWPQDATNASVLIDGDLVYAGTSNGVDRSHTKIPSPEAPSLIALEKTTGRLVAVDDARIGPRIHHGQWSSPSLVECDGRRLLLFGGGDGFCYAFDPTPRTVPGHPTKELRTIWRCDANPPEYRTREGRLLPYNKNAEGPSEIIGTPVFWERKVYVTVGQDTRHGPGKGAITCIDATGSGDISATGKVWTYTGINRSFSTPSIQGGLLFVADFPGDVHCLDAKTGKLHWVHRTEGSMMGSTFVVDGKVFTGNESGQLTILEAGKDLKVLGSISLDSAIDCAPVVANGVLYITTQRRLHAVRSR